jgi:hypothetical protein
LIPGLTDVCNTAGLDEPILLLTNNNYDFQNTLQISHTVLRGESPNLLFDWSGLTRDMRGEPVDPVDDIDLVMISLWDLSRDELTTSISSETLPMRSFFGVIMVYPDGTFTSSELQAFTSNGDPLEWEQLAHYFDSSNPDYDPSAYTHMVSVQSGTVPGKNTKMIGFFTLDSNSDNTTLNILPDSTLVEYEIDLRSLDRIGVLPNTAALSVNWEYLTTTVLGKPFSPPRITRVVVAHFDEMNACDMEENFLVLESRADGWWELVLNQVMIEVSLADLRDTDGTTFPGINTNGTWVLALLCDDCANPAPLFLTILQPC